MPRRRREATVPPPPLAEIYLDLLIGGGEPPPSDEELAAGWEAYGDEIMAAHALAGWRPWGWWVFERGEQMPRREAETLRLAELGELTDSEYAEFAERANEARTRIDTPHEHLSDGKSTDVRAIELYERARRVRS